jgi:hypothetical protein
VLCVGIRVIGVECALCWQWCDWSRVLCVGSRVIGVECALCWQWCNWSRVCFVLAVV